MQKKSVGFIGAGKMATALISCICNKNIAKSIIASNRYEKNLANLKKRFSIKTTKNNKEVVRNSGIVFICVKPHDMDNVLNEIKNTVTNQLIVSIAAGTKIKDIENVLKKKRIIRVMPNINCLVGEMAACFSAGKYATKQDISYISEILNSAGLSFLVREDLLDAVTAISGSGPAFFAYFIQAMGKTGVEHGLPKFVSFKLAAQTALGTGKLLLNNNLPPDDLINMVASKGGTTEAGLKVLKENKTRNDLIKTLEAAIKKSKELGKHAK